VHYQKLIQDTKPTKWSTFLLRLLYITVRPWIFLCVSVRKEPLQRSTQTNTVWNQISHLLHNWLCLQESNG